MFLKDYRAANKAHSNLFLGLFYLAKSNTLYIIIIFYKQNKSPRAILPFFEDISIRNSIYFEFKIVLSAFGMRKNPRQSKGKSRFMTQFVKST